MSVNVCARCKQHPLRVPVLLPIGLGPAFLKMSQGDSSSLKPVHNLERAPLVIVHSVLVLGPQLDGAVSRDGVSTQFAQITPTILEVKAASDTTSSVLHPARAPRRASPHHLEGSDIPSAKPPPDARRRCTSASGTPAVPRVQGTARYRLQTSSLPPDRVLYATCQNVPQTVHISLAVRGFLVCARHEL